IDFALARPVQHLHVDFLACLQVRVAVLGVEHAPCPDPRHDQQQDDEQAKAQGEPGADLQIPHVYLVDDFLGETGRWRRHGDRFRLTLCAFGVLANCRGALLPPAWCDVAKTGQFVIGVAFLIAAVAFFSANDTMARVLGTAAVPMLMAVWFRYVFQLISVAPLLLRQGRRMLYTRRPWMQLMRGLAMYLSSTMAFLSLKY